MAISPPSDIVLDVASAADPAKVRAATDRLARLAADPNAAASSFAEALAATQASSGAAARGVPPTTVAGLPDARDSIASGAPKDPLKVYQKFEAVLLQNFVEAVLPKDTDLFGDKNSADIYRSMMAEQLANQLAKSGRLGIAKEIMAAHPPHGGHGVAKPGPG